MSFLSQSLRSFSLFYLRLFFSLTLLSSLLCSKLFSISQHFLGYTYLLLLLLFPLLVPFILSYLVSTSRLSLFLSSPSPCAFPYIFISNSLFLSVPLSFHNIHISIVFQKIWSISFFTQKLFINKEDVCTICTYLHTLYKCLPCIFILRNEDKNTRWTGYFHNFHKILFWHLIISRLL